MWYNATIYGSSRLFVKPRFYRPRTDRRHRSDHHLAGGGLLHEPLMSLHPLVISHALITDQVSPREVSVILRELEVLLERGARGAVVEFGCYAGTTSLFLRRLLDRYGSEGPFHAYDSFSGLPEKTAADVSPTGEQFRPGELSASKKALMQNFHKAGLVPPIVHKGWFDQLEPTDVPEDIMYAFLDGDYYDSIRDSLRLITPRLLPGATVIVDDYANDALPGARRAVDEWCQARGLTVRVEASLAIIRT